MTQQFKASFLVFLIFVIFTSCKQAQKIKPDKKVLQNKDSCNCGNMEGQPPPPLANSVIAKDTMLLDKNSKSQLFTVALIADKTVYLEEKPLQIFHITASNQDKKEAFDFALPTKHNKYWDRLHIYKDIQKKTFNIGFVNADSNFIHLMYSVYLDTLPFNDGLIRIDFKEQKIKSIGKN